MLGFLTSKVGVYVIAGILLVLFIGGIYWEITHLENKLAAVETKNAQLEIANQQLNANIQALKLQRQQIVRENTRARAADAAAQQASRRVADWNTAKKQQQIAALRQKRPQQLLDIINKNAECTRLHFAENGQCVNGIWQSGAVAP